jgi:formate-dependent nitrite reductase membrane component NrfD
LGTGLVLYTGVLLATMVARPLWNTMVLPPLFLASGLAGGAAVTALAAHLVPRQPAPPQAFLGGLMNTLVAPVPGAARLPDDAATFVRYALLALLAQALLLALYVIGLASGTAAQVEALQVMLSGRFATLFWVLVVAAGVLAPLGLLTVARRSRLMPLALALLLGGGLALRWVIVDAGQATRLFPVLGFGL